MSCNTFLRSAVFGVVAAAGWVPWVAVAGPIAGVWNARALYLIGVTTVYVGGLSPRGARRMTAALVAGLIATAVAFAVRSTAELSIGLAVILGIARSAFLYRSTPARAVAKEAALLVGGLVFARFLAGPSLASTGFAIWGFLLVQSLFFLTSSPGARPQAGRIIDPFEEAHRRALALLERTGV
jgi:hypothetical protein